MYFILIDKEFDGEFLIVKFLGRDAGYHKVCGCSFTYDGSTLNLVRRHFIYNMCFPYKKMPIINVEADDYFVFHFDPDATEELVIHGVGRFPLEQFDTSLFYPQPDTEFEFWD